MRVVPSSCIAQRVGHINAHLLHCRFEVSGRKDKSMQEEKVRR